MTNEQRKVNAERRAKIAAEHPEVVPGTKEHRAAERKRVAEMRKRFPQYNRRYVAPHNGN
jgi:hypothetical protein